jgi:hypothetical protein
MRFPSRLALVWALVCASACSADEADEARPPAPPAPEQRPIPTRPEPTTQVTVEEVPRMDDRALNAAATAAEHAPAGRDLCETAVNGLVAMLEAAESESTNGDRLPRPERADFLAACRALPRAAQQCFVPTYAMAHQQECDRTLSELPQGQLDAVQAAMESEPNE